MNHEEDQSFWTQILSHASQWASCQIRKIAVAHAPGMPGTFSLPPRVSDPDLHHGTCVTPVPWCMLGSLTSGFLWSRWRGKRSLFSWLMLHQQFYASGKRRYNRGVCDADIRRHSEVNYWLRPMGQFSVSVKSRVLAKISPKQAIWLLSIQMGSHPNTSRL